MEWQKKMAFGMVSEWYFKLFLIIPFFCLGQTKKQDKGISFETQYLYLVPYNDEILNPKTSYDLTKDSRISGFNVSVNYYLLHWLSLNIGSGYEKINNPNINYIPILTGFKLADGRKTESFITSVAFGKHIGKFDNSGFIFRWSLGYRFKIFKSIMGTTELYYTYQNLYKTFSNSNRTDNIYNVEAAGLKFGIEIN